ncbi:hypothetical protein CTAYLR_004135 [Chrysophaeum taylorii]|uniref:RING-type domain-containing protein n=1 Tax=Chrysophaeum taylorii TaxID=2483200 RepID=A0AAD7XQK9_9STRA|nr:hypothetical protein CTAYLR_004135 [Chrysophaeum taylorii]
MPRRSVNKRPPVAPPPSGKAEEAAGAGRSRRGEVAAAVIAACALACGRVARDPTFFLPASFLAPARAEMESGIVHSKAQHTVPATAPSFPSEPSGGEVFLISSSSSPSSSSFSERSEKSFVSFSVRDARNRRAPAFFNAEATTRLSVIFEAYARLRNENDARCFFYKQGPPHPRELLVGSMTVEEAGVANGSIVSVTAVVDDSEVCGQGLKSDVTWKKFFNGETAEFSRLARLFLGCALADAAEPDWRRGVDTTTIGSGPHDERPPPRRGQPSAAARAKRLDDENPWQRAEAELREALKMGSRAARVALARLVVVAAHFEARPSFLDDARDALGGDDKSFAEAVATGTQIAASKASRLLARECASETADVDVVASALAAGADVDTRTTDNDRATSLMWAAHRGHGQVVSSLLTAGADPALTNDRGLTAVDLAVDEPTKQAFRANGVRIPDDDDDDFSETAANATAEDPTPPPRALPTSFPALARLFNLAGLASLAFAASRCATDVWRAALRHARVIGKRADLAVNRFANAASRARAAARASRRDFLAPAREAASKRLAGLYRDALDALLARFRPPDAPCVEPRVDLRPMPRDDLADGLRDLDLAALSVATLDRLDKILPDLQRRVVRELLAREPPPPATSRFDRDNECVVCLAAPRAVAFGCGHLCCCENCGKNLADCPVCRTPVKSRHRIFCTT